MRINLSKFLSSFLLAGVVMTGFAGAANSGTNNAQAKKNKPTKVRNPNDRLAKVGDKVIVEDDLQKAMSTIPGELAGKFPEDEMKITVLRNVIRQQLLLNAAKLAHMGQDPAVKREINAAIDKVISQAFLMKILQSRVTESAIRSRYEKMINKFKNEKEVKVCLILTDTEEKAKQAISELNANKDFKKVASKYSILPEQAKVRAAEGIFVLKMALPTEVRTQVEKLKKNEFTKTPIKSEGGYYIAKFIEDRAAKMPTIQESAQHLQMLLIQEETDKYLSELEKQSKIIYYDKEYEEGLKIQEKRMQEAKAKAAF